MKSCTSLARCQSGVTLVEVLVASLLILMALGGILAMNARSIHILRSTRQAVSTSQMLQQRVESIRNRPWPEISNSTAFVELMKLPTDSEAELADNSCLETITVSVPDPLGGAVLGANSFVLQRQYGNVRIVEEADLGTEPMLLVVATLQWQTVQGTQQRNLRTIICRNGLTRSGLFGSVLGRPATAVPVTLP